MPRYSNTPNKRKPGTGKVSNEVKIPFASSPRNPSAPEDFMNNMFGSSPEFTNMFKDLFTGMGLDQNSIRDKLINDREAQYQSEINDMGWLKKTFTNKDEKAAISYANDVNKIKNQQIPDFGFANAAPAMGALLKNMLNPEQRFKDSEINNFTTSPSIIPNYQNGGEAVRDIAQTEIGEMVLMPDLTISEVKSDTTHKKMKDEDITDIFPEGAYIFSDKVKISKKDADVVFAYKQPKYEEEPNDEKVEEYNFKDLFEEKEDKLGTAELLRRIQDKFQVVEGKEDNVLTETANMENKISRQPYLDTLIQLTEIKKQKKGKPLAPVQKFEKGGKVKAKPKQYPIGAAVAGGTALLNTIINLFQKGKQNKQYKQNIGELEQLLETQKGNLNASSLTNILGTLGQDPSETAPDLTATLNTYKQQLDRTPGYLRDYSAGQLRKQYAEAANQVFESAPNFSTASANLQKLYANTSEQQSNLQANQNANDVGLRNQYLQGLSGLYGQDAQFQAQKANQERSNKNQQLGRTSDSVANYFNQISALDTAALNTKFQLQGANTTAQNALTNSAMQNLLIAGTAGSNFIGSKERANPYTFRNQPYNVPGPADVRQNPMIPFQASPLLPTNGYNMDLYRPFTHSTKGI